MVSAPVVNWICSSSSRAAGRTARFTIPAASSACGSEAKARPAAVLREVERLDAERVARQRHRARRAVVDRERVHAAQRRRELRPVPQPQVQRRLVVAVGGEPRRRHLGAQLAVIVDLAVAHQRRRAREQRLVAGREVDDGEPGVHQRDAPDHGVARPRPGPRCAIARVSASSTVGSGAGASEAARTPAMPHMGIAACRQRRSASARPVLRARRRRNHLARQ